MSDVEKNGQIHRAVHARALKNGPTEQKVRAVLAQKKVRFHRTVTAVNTNGTVSFSEIRK